MGLDNQAARAALVKEVDCFHSFVMSAAGFVKRERQRDVVCTANEHLTF